jgi:hypothetical protein
MRRRKGKREMKHMRVVGLIVVIFAAARLAGAQVLNTDVGIPLGSAWNNYGDSIITITIPGTEDQVTPIAVIGPGIENSATAYAGNLILTNGGDAPSDWLADIRFFNPLDPTGALGLPATDDEALFPNDLGPGGFASLQLMPDFNYVPAAVNLTDPGDPVSGIEEVFGPVGGINHGQLAFVDFLAYPGAQAASTPEPGGLALIFGVGIVGVGLLVRRRRQAQMT